MEIRKGVEWWRTRGLLSHVPPSSDSWQNQEVSQISLFFKILKVYFTIFLFFPWFYRTELVKNAIFSFSSVTKFESHKFWTSKLLHLSKKILWLLFFRFYSVFFSAEIFFNQEQFGIKWKASAGYSVIQLQNIKFSIPIFCPFFSWP